MQGGFTGNGMNAQLDTASSGTNDWIVDNSRSSVSCTDVMCTWIVTAYRPLNTSDSNDIVFSPGTDYVGAASWRRFGGVSATSSAAKGASLAPDATFDFRLKVIP